MIQATQVSTCKHNSRYIDNTLKFNDFFCWDVKMQLNNHHDASKMTLRKCLYNEIWPSYGPLCIDMQRKKIEEIVLLHLQSTD